MPLDWVTTIQIWETCSHVEKSFSNPIQLGINQYNLIRN